MPITEKEKATELRKKLSIELCDNFSHRLNPAQSKETKISAIIAIKNFIKESKFDDPILLSFLTDTIADHDKKVRNLVIKVIKDVAEEKLICQEITELLQIKLEEADNQIKNEINKLLKEIST